MQIFYFFIFFGGGNACLVLKCCAHIWNINSLWIHLNGARRCTFVVVMETCEIYRTRVWLGSFHLQASPGELQTSFQSDVEKTYSPQGVWRTGRERIHQKKTSEWVVHQTVFETVSPAQVEDGWIWLTLCWLLNLKLGSLCLHSIHNVSILYAHFPLRH